jgi:hypothetical protein
MEAQLCVECTILRTAAAVSRMRGILIGRDMGDWGLVSVERVEHVQRRSDGDLRLAARAIRERWPVPQARRAQLVNLLLDTACGPAGRDRNAAVRALIDMTRHNVEAFRAAGELDYADLMADVESLRGQLGQAEAGGPPSEGAAGVGGGSVH